MFVSTRKPKETILIGDAKVIIISVKGERVKIGIEAPEGTKILRGELEEEPQK